MYLGPKNNNPPRDWRGCVVGGSSGLLSGGATLLGARAVLLGSGAALLFRRLARHVNAVL